MKDQCGVPGAGARLCRCMSRYPRPYKSCWQSTGLDCRHEGYGALSALTGATGNSVDYIPYLEAGYSW